MPARRQVLVLCLALVGTTACGGVSLDTVRADVGAGHGHLLAGVPFIPQAEYQCGPAALAMVLQYHGLRVSPDEIAQALAIPSLRGTLNLDLERYARRRGLDARAFPGTLARAKDELRRGRPLIVFQDLGAPPRYPVPHFAVLVGYDDRAGAVVLHSGTTAYRVVPYADFERTWARQRGWTLLVTRAGDGAAAPRRGDPVA